MSSPTTKSSDDRLVIAVDFGTTFSGVAYAFNVPGKKADITPIQDWPGLEGYRQPKVPTLIMYDEKDPSKFKWGGQVNWRDPAVRGVKLLLDPDQKRPAYFPASSFEQQPGKPSKDADDIAADFIGAVYKHALSVVKGAGLQEYMNFCQKDFILSVPASWSDKAKDLTLKASTTPSHKAKSRHNTNRFSRFQAAKKAEIHPVTLIKEPEAAALYTLTTHNHSIKEGDAFVLCDAGGGTVDLITYKVERMKPRLQLKELVPGKGGMVGSLALNNQFEQAVQKLVGEDQFYHLQKTIGWSKALNDFDKNIKTAFNGDLDDIHYISFPKANLKDDVVEGLTGNCWEMTGETLMNIFEPIIKDILRLVDDQVQKALAQPGGQGLKAIFLVGGFGSSRYLKARLDQVYEPRGIQVVQPHDAWGAIVNGGVLSRVSDQATVVSTKAVRHYGVTAYALYDPEEDFGRETVVRPYSGNVCVEKVTWFIRMGDDLHRDRTIKFSFSRHLGEDYTPDDLIFTDDLVFSEKTDAPDYPGPDMRTCCSVRSDLRSLRKKDLRRRRGPRGIYYSVSFDLVLCTAHANMKFSLEFNGMEMGSVEATYE